MAAGSGSADEDSTLEYVRKWIESSGRGLELRVARTMRRDGATGVDQSFYYTDPLTGVRREGDVRARYEWESPLAGRFAQLLAVIECKSNNKHPWVAFYDSKLGLSSRLDHWFFAHGTQDTRVADPLASQWAGEPPFDDRRLATHIVAARSSRDGDGSNPAGDAVRQVGSTAVAQYCDWLEQADKRRAAIFVAAAVVTAAPLYTCALNREGEVVVERVEHLVVMGDSGKPRRVHVMNENHLPTFGRGLSDLADLATQQAIFIRETNSPAR